MNREAKWIGHPTATVEAPCFKKVITVDAIPAKAEVDICGLGYYELYINGQKADDRLLSPPPTQYNTHMYYDHYDITAFIKPGKNVIGVMLGNGTYNNKIIGDMVGFDHAEWNANPCLLCEVKFDGQTVAVSNRTFKTTIGPVTYNAHWVGEAYDARAEIDWMADDQDSSLWTDPMIVRPPGGVLEHSGDMQVRIMDVYEPVDVWDIDEKTKVYDFGQNLTGFVLLSGKGKPGSQVVCAYSELLGENRDIDQSHIRIYCFADEFQTDKYTFADHEIKDWHPHFAFHGFRYMRVVNEGGAEISVKAALVRSDFERAGDFRCSDELLNKLQHNTVMSTITNFVHAPSDCPHREKLYWTGDGQLSAEQTLFNHDAGDYYLPWLRMFPHAQRASGFIPATVPRPGCCYVDHDGPVWDSAMFIIPEQVYRYTGDTRCIEAVYDACKKYLGYAYSLSDDYIITHGHGDWCYYKTLCDSGITSTTYYYLMARAMELFAQLLGKDDEIAEYTELKNAIRDAYQRHFIKDGDMTDHSLCAYAITLANGLADDKDIPSLREGLLRAVEAADYHIDGGILTAKFLLCVLSDMGRHDLAVKIATQTDLPGWGYAVSQGATTLWEDWHGGGSQNHHMFGSISEWYYKCILGLNQFTPGFKEITLRPNFDCLTFAEGWHKAPCGTFRIRWDKKDDEVVYVIEIPAGVTATVVAPAGYVCGVTELGAGENTVVFKKA